MGSIPLEGMKEDLTLAKNEERSIVILGELYPPIYIQDAVSCIYDGMLCLKINKKKPNLTNHIDS